MLNLNFPASDSMTRDPASAVRVDENGGLAEDIACRKCGYNLRGLRTEGVCPECGTAVGRSLYGDFLRYCDPAWVRTLAKGMNWIAAAVIVRVVLGCIGGGMVGAARFIVPRFTIFPLQSIVVVADVVALVGYWLATTPDPAKADYDGLSSRKLVRVAKVCAVLVGVITPVMMQLTSLLGASFTVLSGGTTVLEGLISIVGTIAVFAYARSLALRIPDEKTASECRVVMGGLVVAQTLMLVQIFLGMAMMSSIARAGGFSAAAGSAGAVATRPANAAQLTQFTFGPGGTTVVSTSGPVATSMPVLMPAFPISMVMLGVIGCGFALVSLVFTIWGLVLISRFRRAFLEQAALAERIWASAPPTAG